MPETGESKDEGKKTDKSSAIGFRPIAGTSIKEYVGPNEQILISCIFIL